MQEYPILSVLFKSSFVFSFLCGINPKKTAGVSVRLDPLMDSILLKEDGPGIGTIFI